MTSLLITSILGLKFDYFLIKIQHKSLPNFDMIHSRQPYNYFENFKIFRELCGRFLKYSKSNYIMDPFRLIVQFFLQIIKN